MQQDDSSRENVGVVVIGRNEGPRLRRCLQSLHHLVERVVYVDSGSCDDSVVMSRSLGVRVLELDMRTPFTAARARNEGFRVLLEAYPTLDYVFFVDGDCEVVAGWLEAACCFLDQESSVAVAWGRRRERYPEKSVYNMLCDIEWQDIPVGETNACGGDAVVRVSAFRKVNGYRSDLICGEEPEMCVRLRRAGWRIWRLPHDMTLHDAAIHRFSQWWKRTVRTGYGYAQGVALHGSSPEGNWVSRSRRVWFWGLWLPLAALASVAWAGWWGLLILALYPLQVVRLAARGTHSTDQNWLRAGALTVSKFPEMVGQVKFILDRHRRIQTRIIEYK